MPNEFVIKQFRNLEPGDVIYAKRYRTKKEKNKIEEGHKVGPYIIIKMDYDKLYCLYGTSVIPSKNSKKSFYKTTKKYLKEKNGTYVNSYFCLDYIEVIDVNRFLGKRYCLDNSEFNKIYKIIKQNININIIDSPSLTKNKKKKKIKKSTKKTIKIEIPYEIQIGDIILKNNNYYLVTKKENKKLKCLPLKGDDDNLKKGIISEQLSSLEYIDFVEIEEDDNIEFVYYIGNSLLDYIIKKHEDYLININMAQRGSVLLFNNQLYYVYYRENDKLYSYEIFENMKDSSIKVLINGLTYYIDFNNVNVINYYDDYKIKFLANEYDMDEIKKIREKYLRKQKNKNTTSCETNKPKTKYNNLKAGNIVKLKNNEKCNYVVIKCYNDLLVCISELDLLNKHKNILIININNIKYVCKEITEKRIENNKLMLKNLYDEKELNKIIVENIRRNEFNNVKVFDIIDAKNIFENDKKIELELFDEESYLVIGRDEKRLYCLRGSQEIKEYSDFYIVFSCLIKYKDNEEKTVYYTNRDIQIINYDKFININKTLNNEEKIELVRNLKKQTILKNKKNYYDIDLSFNIGDIVKKDRLYLIINKIDSQLYCIPFENNINLEKIDYNDIIMINEDDGVELINKISDNLFNKINLNEMNYLNYEKNKIKKLKK